MNNDNRKIEDFVGPIKEACAKLRLLILIERAKNEYDKNNYEGCEKNCKEILASNPNNAIALRGLGCVMLSYGKPKEAIEYYQKALEFSQNKEIEYTLIGTVYYMEENLEEAIKYYNLAIDSNDNYEKAYEGRNQAMLENHLKIIDLQDSLIKRNLF